MRTRMRLFAMCGVHPWAALWPSWAPLQRHAALMVYAIVQVLILLMFVLLMGCTASPLAASPQVVTQPVYVPLHHNIPASFSGREQGPIYWLCATQPRRYVRQDGTVLLEEDHYLQDAPCPTTPIE